MVEYSISGHNHRRMDIDMGSSYGKMIDEMTQRTLVLQAIISTHARFTNTRNQGSNNVLEKRRE